MDSRIRHDCWNVNIGYRLLIENDERERKREREERADLMKFNEKSLSLHSSKYPEKEEIVFK